MSNSRFTSSISSMIWRLHGHVERGRRLVRKSGSTGCARAPIAIIARWRMPPEKLMGGKSAVLATSRSGCRRGPSSSTARAHAASLLTSWCAVTASAILGADAIHRMQARETDPGRTIAMSLPRMLAQVVLRQRQQGRVP